MNNAQITTFARRSEFEQATNLLDRLRLPYQVLEPPQSYRLVATPALILKAEERLALARQEVQDFHCSGWVAYRPTRIKFAPEEPRSFHEDVLGTVAIMVLGPCIADEVRVRAIAHIGGELTEVFPYLNAEMHGACYNRHAPVLTFMEQHRLVTLYPRSIALAKADDLFDVWRLLENIRQRVNDVWARRQAIVPCFELREKPPVLEIYKRLPRTNCRACGESTCMAFAAKLWRGEAVLSECTPAWEGEYSHLREMLMDICSGLDVAR